MEKNFNFRFKIEKPCSQDWKKMKIGVNSRHCLNCNKSVIDFTKSNKKEIFEYLQVNKNKSICGKLTKKQVDFQLNYKELIINKKQSNLIEIPIYAFAIGSLLTINSCNTSIESGTNNIEQITTNIKQKQIKEEDSLKKTSEIINNKSTEEIIEIIGDIDIDFVDEEPFHYVDKKAEFIGGDGNFREYFKSKFSSDSLKGKAYCYFIVDKVGKIKNIRVRTSCGIKIQEKITTILKNMPDWKPGEKNGEIVESIYTFPIVFK